MTVSVYASLDDLPDGAARLLSYEAQADLFASIEWFRCLSRYGLPADCRLRLYVVASDRRPDETCFLFCMQEAAGGRLASLSNFYTLAFAPVFSRPDCDKAALLAELAAHIARETPAWHHLNLRLLAEDGEATRLLEGELSGAGFALNRYFQFENYYINTAGVSFEAYYASRPSKVKNTIKRKAKKLGRSHEFAIQLERDYDEAAISAYLAVYAESWKESEQFPAFIRALCRTAADLGLLRLGVVTVEDKPAAAQLWLISGRKAIIYKLAYDEAYKDFSVGSILTKAMAEFVLEGDRVEEIDYGVGSEPYKQDWMAEKRRLVGLEAFNRRTLIGNLAYARWRLGRLVKARLPGS